LDAQAPPPPPAVVEPAPLKPGLDRVATTDFYARSARERDLCQSASHPDWLYLAVQPLLVAGAIALDTQVFKYDWATFGGTEGSTFVRDIGPEIVGLTWGTFIGSFIPSMPKCSPHFVSTIPPEGQIRTSWPLAFAFAFFAGMTAPFVDYIAIGPVPDAWSNGERVSRVVLASTFAFGAAFIPYLLPPKTMRAARELENIRATVSAQGTFVSYTTHF
jgi:hypothetical protein